MKRGRLLRSVLYALGALSTFSAICTSPPTAVNAQSCCTWDEESGGTYSVGRWQTVNYQEYYCISYYETIDYYYCGQYRYTNDALLSIRCYVE